MGIQGAAALAVLAGLGAAFGMGLTASHAMDAVARQPEAAGKINTLLILSLALIESIAIYGFVVALLIIFTAK